MCETVKERLLTFIREKGLSVRHFEKSVGLSCGYVANMAKGIGNEKLKIILNTYPDLNPTWLTLGQGEMLIKMRKQEDEYENVLIKLLKEKDDTIKEQAEEIGRMKERMAQLQKEIAELQKKYTSKQEQTYGYGMVAEERSNDDALQ